jgi:hypothetical protein
MFSSIVWALLTSVLLLRLLRADVAQQLHLLHHFVVQNHDIFRLDIGGPVLLEQHQFISYMLQAVQYRLLRRIEGKRDGGGICHVARGRQGFGVYLEQREESGSRCPSEFKWQRDVYFPRRFSCC